MVAVLQCSGSGAGHRAAALAGGKKKKTIGDLLRRQPEDQQQREGDRQGLAEHRPAPARSARGIAAAGPRLRPGPCSRPWTARRPIRTGIGRCRGSCRATLPAGTNSVRVKATKRTAGKFVCKAGSLRGGRRSGQIAGKQSDPPTSVGLIQIGPGADRVRVRQLRDQRGPAELLRPEALACVRLVELAQPLAQPRRR